jgi:hypothetical protein
MPQPGNCSSGSVVVLLMYGFGTPVFSHFCPEKSRPVGIVVSESSVVRLFCHGKLAGEIIPELWMMDHTAQLRGSVKKETFGDLTVLTPSIGRASTAK